MGLPKVRVSRAYNEVFPNMVSDFAWVRENREQLLEKYGECVLLVYEKQVVGIGQTLNQAIEDAEKHLPAEVPEITPVMEHLRHRHPFLRIRPVQ